VEWQEHGLGEPESVASATEQYRTEMDTLAAFLEDRCVLGEGLVAPASPLYTAYRDWCEETGETVEAQKMFGMRLRERGFVSEKITSGPHKDRKGWLDIGLRADDQGPDNGGSGSKTPVMRPSDSPDGPLSGPLADHCPLAESRINKPKTRAGGGEADHSGPKNQNLQAENPREVKVLEKRSASSASSASSTNTPANHGPELYEEEL